MQPILQRLQKFINEFTSSRAFLQSKLPDEKTADISKEEKSTFEHQLNPAQINLLTECLNDVRMFPESITSQTLENIFSCNLSPALKARNNRLLAYFPCFPIPSACEYWR